MTNQLIKITTISLFTSTFLLGATPNIGTVEEEIKQAPKVEKPKPKLLQLMPKEYKKPMVDSGQVILIKDIKISGNAHISIEELEKLYVEFKNKELAFNQIQNIAILITKYYRQKGYFVARAYVPTQNILQNNNVLEIIIVEGRYGEFKIENTSLVKDKVVQGILDAIKQKDNVISTGTLERAMLIINDTPGAVVTKADVSPGKVVGTSDFTMGISSTKETDGYIIADNAGGRYTGTERVMLGANANSISGIGDKLSFTGLYSGANGLHNARFIYSRPLNYSGLIGEVSFSETKYELGKENSSLNASGVARTIEGNISYPVIRTANQNLYTALVLNRKKMEDTSSGTLTRKSLKSISFELDYDKKYLALGFNSASKGLLSITAGELSDTANDNTGTNADGEYGKVNLLLTNKIDFTPEYSLETRISGQYAMNKNLDGSEDFSIGGTSGVKLYPSGELSAENGYLFNIEAKYKLPAYNGVSNTIGLFYDVGRAFMIDSSSDSTFNPRVLQDAGLGYYASYQQFFGQLQVATQVGGKPITAEPERDSKVLFQLGMSF